MRAQDEIMKIFALFDEDGTGGISFRNLKRVATELGENLTDDELQVRKLNRGVAGCMLLSFFGVVVLRSTLVLLGGSGIYGDLLCILFIAFFIINIANVQLRTE